MTHSSKFNTKSKVKLKLVTFFRHLKPSKQQTSNKIKFLTWHESKFSSYPTHRVTVPRTEICTEERGRRKEDGMRFTPRTTSEYSRHFPICQNFLTHSSAQQTAKWTKRINAACGDEDGCRENFIVRLKCLKILKNFWCLYKEYCNSNKVSRRPTIFEVQLLFIYAFLCLRLKLNELKYLIFVKLELVILNKYTNFVNLCFKLLKYLQISFKVT